jgi:hypothetical protein
VNNTERKRFTSHDCSQDKEFKHCTILAHSWSKIVTSLKCSNRLYQLEIDFSKGFFKCDKLQVGCIGLSDVHHVFWPMIFIVCESENQINSVRLLQTAIQIFDQCAISNVRYLLKDGGTAIQSGYEIIKEKRADFRSSRCMAHMFRAGFTRGGGYQ